MLQKAAETKILRVVWVLVLLVYIFIPDAICFENKCSSDRLNKQLELSELLKWFRHSPSSKSFARILSGNPFAHLDAVETVISCSSVYYLQRPESRVYIDSSRLSDGESSLQISNFLKTQVDSRKRIKWSLVFVKNAQNLSTFEINDILDQYHNRKSCEIDKVEVDCSKLLILLSTNFGMSRILQFDSVDQNSNQEDIEHRVFQQVRKTWPSGLVFSDHRRLVSIVHGRSSKQGARDLIKFQNQARKSSSVAFAEQTNDGLSFLEKSGFIGQESVMSRVKQGLNAAKRGLKLSNGPLIFLFAGLPGTGKTYLSQLIAIAYNSAEISHKDKSIGEMIDDLSRQKLFLHVDMGNYQDDRAIDGFVDPSPGLAGEGLLSTLFSHSSNAKTPSRAVIVLDEIEKAHPSLLKDMLLPVLDSNNGHVQKKKSGDTFSTRDAVFILTTNCFDDVILDLSSSGASYEKIVKAVGDLFTSPTAHCLSANKADSQRNPFAWGPLWRRIMAGQSLATHDHFFAFLPPTKEDVDALVELSLETMNRKFRKSYSGVSGLYYTNNALKKLQRAARTESSKIVNMAQVESFVERTVANLLVQGMERDSEIASKRKVVVLFVDFKQRLVADYHSEDATADVEESWSSLFGDFFGGANSKAAEEKPLASMKVDQLRGSENPEISHSEQTKLGSQIQRDEETEKDLQNELNLNEALSLLLTIGLAIMLMYFVALPLLQSILVISAVVFSILYMISPELAKKILSAIVFVGSFILDLIRSGQLWIFIYFIAAAYLLRLGYKSYHKTRLADRSYSFKTSVISLVENDVVSVTSIWNLLHNKVVKRKSSSSDVIRRWALLTLKLQISKARLATRKTRLGLTTPFSREFIYKNRNRLTRANSNPDVLASMAPLKAKKKYSFFRKRKAYRDNIS